jgi:probable phosphoglycerate mutase
MKTRLILVRHAEAEGNYKREFHGWTDGGITDKGHIQANLAADKLKDYKIDKIISSTLLRTKQTAGYISKAKKLKIFEDERLKEINGGLWEGKTWDELPKLWPKEYDTWENKPHLHKMPKGETMKYFYERVLSAVKDIVKNNLGKNICIVTHGTAIRTLMCYFHNYDLEKMLIIRWFDNTSITVVDIENEMINLVEEGNDSHLGEYGTIRNQEWWAEYIKKHNENIKSEVE